MSLPDPVPPDNQTRRTIRCPHGFAAGIICDQCVSAAIRVVLPKPDLTASSDRPKPPRTRAHTGVSPSYQAVAEIVEAVAAVYQTTPADLLSSCRARSFVEARQCVYLVARRCTRLSLSELGRALNRDHTTVLVGVRRIEARCAEDRWVAAAVDGLLKQFGELEGVLP